MTIELSKSSFFLLSILFITNLTIGQTTYIVNDTVNNKSDKINIEFRNILETVAILQHLWVEVDGGWPYAKLNNPVKDDINSYFKNFKKHKAVKLTRKIANGKASFSAPLLIALSLSPLPKTNINYNPHYLYQTIHNKNSRGERIIAKYLKSINHFYENANVEGFLKKHNYFYEMALNQLTQNSPKKETILGMENYYRKIFSNYSIIPSLTNFPMAFGHTYSKDNQVIIYQTLSINSPINESLQHYGFHNRNTIYELTFHEYGHSFVNVINNKELKSLTDNTAYLLKPIKDDMLAIAYGDWETVLEEHIVRAVEIRIWEVVMKNIEKANSLRIEYIDNKKFKYIPFIEEQLKVYEANKIEFTSFDVILPKLISSLKMIEN